MISRQLFSKSRGKPNCNNGLGFRNGVKCLRCFTIYHHFLCMSVLLCGGRFSNLALSRIKNPGCVAAFCAMRTRDSGKHASKLNTSSRRLDKLKSVFHASVLLLIMKRFSHDDRLLFTILQHKWECPHLPGLGNFNLLSVLKFHFYLINVSPFWVLYKSKSFESRSPKIDFPSSFSEPCFSDNARKRY